MYDLAIVNSSRWDLAVLLQRLSNVAEPGLWVFKVDGLSIESGGDIYICICVNIVLLIPQWFM